MIKYRTEMSVDSERKAIPVMLFEITELHNADILEYIKEHYDMPRILKQNIQEYINNIDEIEEDDDVVEYMLKEIISCIEEDTGKKIRYALWLADKEAVKELYDGDELDVYAYNVDDALVLSDLGYDGTLYGFETMPEPLDSELDEKFSYNYNKALYEKVMRNISKEVKKMINKKENPRK